MRYTTVAAKYGFGLHTFCEWPTWFDGSPLSDKKNSEVFDDILFKKKTISGKVYYYKRYIEGNLLNIEDFGVMARNQPEANTKNINQMIDSFPQGYAAGFALPIGDFNFADTIFLDGKPFRFQGVNGSAFAAYNTKLMFPEGKTGIHVSRNKTNDQEPIISDLMVQAKGSKSIEWASGINANARITIERCTAKNFSHNGFDLWGNLPEGDVSGSLIFKCHSLENGHDGFFAGRVDGNCVNFAFCDARDNGGYGFNDDSFLGCNFISPMAHYNKQGDFNVRDWGNARTGVLFPYSEGGNKLSSLSDKSSALGGIWGTGYTINGVVK